MNVFTPSWERVVHVAVGESGHVSVHAEPVAKRYRAGAGGTPVALLGADVERKVLLHSFEQTEDLVRCQLGHEGGKIETGDGALPDWLRWRAQLGNTQRSGSAVRR